MGKATQVRRSSTRQYRLTLLAILLFSILISGLIVNQLGARHSLNIATAGPNIRAMSEAYFKPEIEDLRRAQAAVRVVQQLNNRPQMFRELLFEQIDSAPTDQQHDRKDANRTPQIPTEPEPSP